MGGRLGWLGAAAAVACAFDAGGVGEGSDAGGDTTAGDTADDGESSQNPTATTASTLGGSGSSGPGGAPTSTMPSTSTSQPSSDGSGDGESSTGSGIDCSQPYGLISWVQAGNETFPMVVSPAWGDLPTAPDVAYSGIENLGSIDFPFDVPCTGEHFVWGLVWDRFAGASPCGAAHADSFWVGVDTPDPSVFYAYGCAGCGGADAIWFWQGPVRDYQGPSCGDQLDYSVMLDAGPHTVTLRNREFGSISLPTPDVAAVAAIVISNRNDYDPTILFAP